MQLTESPRAEGIRRLYELMLRVNSSTDLSEVLDEIARGVVEVLGYGIAAIARLEGETFVMTTVAGPEEVREQIIGRRTPVASIFNEFAQADEWGVLRFVPHDRMPDALEESAWVPDFEPGSGAGLLAPARRALRPALLRHRPAARQHVGGPAAGQPDPEPGGARAPGDVRRAGRPGDVQRPAARAARQPGPDGRHAALPSPRPDSSPSWTSRCERRPRPSPRGLQTEHLWIRCFPSGDLGQVEQSAAYPPDDRETSRDLVQLKSVLASRAWELGRPVRDQPGQRLPARRRPHRGPALPGLGAGPRLRRLQPDVRARSGSVASCSATCCWPATPRSARGPPRSRKR